jgi:hypothetical protein
MTTLIVNGTTALIILGIMYALTSEGLWGAALMFFNVIFSGLIAFNFYEPLAELLASNVPQIASFADTLCLLGLFLISLILLRVTTESIAPGMVRFPKPLFHLGRLFFGLAGGVVTVAILLLAFYTSPVDKKVFGVIDYKFKPPFGTGIDRGWLSFFQYTTGYIFADYNNEVIDPEFGQAKVFDPQGAWLINHQNARPYGKPNVPESEAPPPPPSSDGGGGGQAPPTSSQSSGGYGQQGNAPAPPGSTIGGPAGAAAGVAPQ